MSNKIEPTAIYAEWLETDSIITADNVNNSLVLCLVNISSETISAEVNDNIRLGFPVGDEKYHLTTTDLAKQIACTPPYDWKSEFDESNCSWIISPQSSLSIESNDSIVIVFSNIVSDKNRSSMSCLNIDFESSNGINSRIQLPVFMLEAPVHIKKFTCDHNMIGILDEITFNWETMGGITNPNQKDSKTGIFLLPDYTIGKDSQLKPVDSATCTVTETMDFSLCVSNGKETAIEHCPIYVYTPEICNFSYTKAENASNKFTLNFTLKNTCHCYINKGIGRVDCKPSYSDGYLTASGSVDVILNNSAIFRLSCLDSENVICKEITITL
ncbi:MAG: hypothetical protein ACM3KR_07180 [Deltaproteobacteria bacterium]